MNGRAFLILLAVVVCHSPSRIFATDVVFSGNSGFGLEGSAIGSQSGGLIAFNTEDISTANVPFDFPGNLDAVHILENGNYLVSYHSEITIAGFTFDDDHIVEYDVSSNEVTSFFDYAGILTSPADADIDAFFLLSNGNHVFSNRNDGSIGGLDITSNDLVEYNPTTGEASIFWDGSLIKEGDRFNNLSGASLFADDVLALSVSTGGTPDISIGGQAFQRNEIVLYDMAADSGSLLVGNELLSATAVNGIHIGQAVVVPEPATECWFVCFLALGFFRRKR